MPNESNEQYEWGLKTAKQLLQEKGYADFRVKKIDASGQWRIQFRVQFNKPWNDNWIPVQDEMKFWTVFRERICSQIDLAHAKVAEVIDSKGFNLGPIDGVPPAPKKPPRKQKRVRFPVMETEATIKQELDLDTAPIIQRAAEPVDLTAESPPRSPAPLYEPSAFGDGIGSPDIQRTNGEDVIDLTSVDDVIYIEDDAGGPESALGNRGTRESNEPGEESDRESLFGGNEEPEFRREFNEMDDADIFTYQSQPSVRSAPISVRSDSLSQTSPRSTPFPQIKSGRKRALDIMEELDSTATRPPPKKAKSVGLSRTNSLFTAVGGQAVVRGRNGAYQAFSAVNSSGSKLAERQRNRTSNDITLKPAGSKDVISPGIPVVIPEDLEDYEEGAMDEDFPSIEPVLNPIITAQKERWGSVERPKSAFNPIYREDSKGPDVRPRDPNSPSLFLLRLEDDKTLRLTLKQSSLNPPLPQFCLRKSFKQEPSSTRLSSLSENEIEPRIPGYIWTQHKTNLYDLISDYHKMDLEENTRRQQEIIQKQILCRDLETAGVLKRELDDVQKLIWAVGEKEKTQTIPRVADVSEAENLLFQISEGDIEFRLDPVYDASRRGVGAWAELILHEDKYNRVSQSDEKDYERLVKWLRKNNKFLVIESSLVDKRRQFPHTLLVFPSALRAMATLCGLPENLERFTSRHSLVMIHIGRNLSFTRFLEEFRYTD